ncbi:unnamed protein product [Cochlearia groenlandica]
MEKQANGGLGLLQCVKIIRKLESLGHVERHFRIKFLTWFSLTATAREIKIVESFVNVFEDDLEDLAAQLVDTFSNCILRKRFASSGSGGGASA